MTTDTRTTPRAINLVDVDGNSTSTMPIGRVEITGELGLSCTSAGSGCFLSLDFVVVSQHVASNTLSRFFHPGSDGSPDAGVVYFTVDAGAEASMNGKDAVG